MICEIDVGIILRYAWKYPRNTPHRPDMKIVGASICSARRAFAILSGTRILAPNTQTNATMPPATAA